MLRSRKKVLLLSLPVAAFVVGGGLLLYFTGLLELLLDRERLLEAIDRNLGYAVFIFIGLQALQVVAAPIPGEATGF
ncbi:MAG: TVP38/TMEM64 family protein, partial [Pseudomonadota bacterium]